MESNLVTDTIGLYIGYSKNIIKSTGGLRKIGNHTNIYSDLLKQFLYLYDTTTNKNVAIRRIGVNFANVINSSNIKFI